MRFRFGARAKQLSKTRVVSISILIMALLLVSATLALKSPILGKSGEMSVEESSPINQSTTCAINRIPFQSVNSVIVMNTSKLDATGRISGTLPRFDYDRLVFNVTVTPKRGLTAVMFVVYSDIGARQTVWSINQTTTIPLELNVFELKMESNNWLFSFTAEVQPIEDVIIQELIVWAYSDVPLVPVTFDLQTTDGSSIFASPFSREISDGSPYLYLSENNDTRNSDSLWPRIPNLTLYLRPGSLNGSAQLYGSYDELDSIPFNLTFSTDERVRVDFQMLMIRIDLSIDSRSPIVQIQMIQPHAFNPVYNFFVTSDTFLLVLYVPPISSVIFAVSISDMMYYGGSSLSSLCSASEVVNLTGLHNLRVDAKFGQFSFFGIAATSDIILDALSLTVFLLILIRIGLAVYTPEKKTQSKSKLALFVLYCTVALLPWFFSTRTLWPSSQDFGVTIHSLSLGPLPIVGFWTDGSSIVWTIPPEALYWSIASIILYWIPVFWTVFSIDTSGFSKNKIWATLFLLIPLGLVLYADLGLIYIVGEFPSILFPTVLLVLIPIIWLCITGILSYIEERTKNN